MVTAPRDAGFRSISMHRFSRSIVVLVVLSALATACSQDPEVRKREFVASGDRYIAQSKHNEAIIQYRNAIALDSRFGEARFKLAEALAAAGDASGAGKEYIRAADLLPNDSRAQIAAGRM